MPHDFHNLAVDQNVALELWKTAPDLETLIELNKQYIRGELACHAGHSESVAKETSDVVSGLITMNEYGLFAFQGQPKTSGTIVQPCFHNHDEFTEKKADDASWCRTCIIKTCHTTMWTEVRQMPYLQMIIPIPEAVDTIPGKYIGLIHTMMTMKNIHVMLSWPRDMPLPRELATREWIEADLSTAPYISQEDLGLFKHFKSKHGTSCAHQVRRASELAGLHQVEWANESSSWCEVNDLHLLRKRTPEWLFGPRIPTIGIGINIIDWEDETSLEDIVIFAAKEHRIKRCFFSRDGEVPVENGQQSILNVKDDSKLQSLQDRLHEESLGPVDCREPPFVNATEVAFGVVAMTAFVMSMLWMLKGWCHPPYSIE